MLDRKSSLVELVDAMREGYPSRMKQTHEMFHGEP